MIEMAIEDYLAEGGVLSSPSNAPPRYRAELMRLMASFVDSEMAGAAGFSGIVDVAPGPRERAAAVRIVEEKTVHAGQVLAIMGGFGADTGRYAARHPWGSRLARDADIGTARQGPDMRLNVFHYPLEGWTDAVVMNVLMGRAVAVQLGELARVSYQPLAEAFRAIGPREARHAERGEAGLRAILAGGGAAEAAESAAYWWPRVAASFGPAASERFALLQRFGLRRRSNAELRAEWEAGTGALMRELGLPAG